MDKGALSIVFLLFPNLFEMVSQLCPSDVLSVVGLNLVCVTFFQPVTQFCGW
jgi:hypothetical protein